VKGNSYGLANKPPAGAPIFHGTLKAGDALLHHSQVFHRSDPNRSDRPRMSLVVVYRGSAGTGVVGAAAGAAGGCWAAAVGR
jgi:ectoine hydroxylase-related dioxygenase (phytanoyl-CoA dioxygenase family)